MNSPIIIAVYIYRYKRFTINHECPQIQDLGELSWGEIIMSWARCLGVRRHYSTIIDLENSYAGEHVLPSTTTYSKSSLRAFLYVKNDPILLQVRSCWQLGRNNIMWFLSSLLYYLSEIIATLISATGVILVRST